MDKKEGGAIIIDDPFESMCHIRFESLSTIKERTPVAVLHLASLYTKGFDASERN
jgi:hypothetical protein